MKWALCTSTALCTVFLLQCDEAGASQFEFSISGYLATLVSAGKLNTTASRDDPSIDPDYNATGGFEYGEYWITARQELSKDYVFGGQLEFDTFPLVEPDFNTSEHYIFVDTPYGLFNVGARYSAAYQMQYAAPILSLPINSGWVTAFIPPNPDSTVAYRTPAVSTYIDYGSKENNLTYYTPRLGGFQLGISYAPAISFTGDGQNFPVEAERNTQYYNGLSVGVNYVDTLDQFDVAIAAGYRRTDASAEILDAGGGDYQAVSFGASASRWGVTVGGLLCQFLRWAGHPGRGGNHQLDRRHVVGHRDCLHRRPLDHRHRPTCKPKWREPRPALLALSAPAMTTSSIPPLPGSITTWRRASTPSAA